MSRVIITLIILLGSSLPILAQDPEINQKAPPILVNNWVENPNYPTMDISDRAVVLKFWFTTCGPCVYSIPHMNDLAEKFSGEDLAFVSISFEKPALIKDFLRNKDFLSMAGSDTARTTIENYGVRGYPVVFLIDKDGILRWRGNPMTLNEDMIEYFLEVTAEGSQNRLNAEAKKITELGFENPSYTLDISENTTKMGEAEGQLLKHDELTIANYTLKSVLAYLLDTSEYRLKLSGKSNKRYDIRFKVHQGLDSLTHMHERLASVIADRLGYQLVTVQENEPAYELTVSHDSLFNRNFLDKESKFTKTEHDRNEAWWKGRGLDANDIINNLENNFNVYFVDGIGLDNRYRMHIPTNSFDSLSVKLKEFYGISLEKVKSEVEIIRLVPK